MPRLGTAAILPSVLQDEITSAEQKPFWQLESRLQDDLLVRDLGDGSWSKCLSGCRKDVEVLLTALRPQGRIVRSNDSMNQNDHTAYRDWSGEQWLRFARRSHEQDPVDVVIRRDSGRPKLTGPEVQLCRIDEANWMTERARSGSVPRTETALSRELQPFLLHSKWLDIVDPGIDATSTDYGYLQDTIRACASRRHTPLLLSIHRSCYDLLGAKRVAVSNEEWIRRFASCSAFGKKRVLVRICVWSDLHDRMVVGNLGGLHLGNGLASTSQDDSITLSWLEAKQAEDALRAVVKRAKRQKTFTIPDGELEQFTGSVV